ncbi:MAG: hypothetical protein HC847_00115 [Hydrococcus sp. RU_2_2]|nr:hypothetical protein [Hydrococcus sp. RU_2_2]NJQ98398.1 hypothetical protein [Hydrococcus sp. CSU_1_8]
MWQFSDRLARSITLLRWVGYGLLIFFGLDTIETLTPLRFTNPAWEFQTMGTIIEQIAVPLIGLALIFFGELNLRSPGEIFLVKTLSWLTLLGAIVMFLLIPLGIVNTVRIERQSNEQITSQLNQQLAQIQQVKEQLTKATTKEEMQALVGRLDTQGRAPEIENSEQLGQIKLQLSDFIEQSENTIKAQTQTIQKDRRLTLLKSSFKWNIGALISGVLFALLWQGTHWARRKS